MGCACKVDDRPLIGMVRIIMTMIMMRMIMTTTITTLLAETSNENCGSKC